MDDLHQRVEQWYHLPATVTQLYTLFAIHFLDLPTLFLTAVLLDLVVSVAKYLIYSPFEWLYLTLGHSVILWLATIGTFLFLGIQGEWVRAVYPLAFFLLLSSVAGLPGLLVDGVVGRRIGQHPKYLAASKLGRS